MEDTVSPSMLKKVLWASARAASFEEASDAMLTLAEKQVSAERVRRASGHVGQDMVDEQQVLRTTYQAKSLPEQAYGKPADVVAPQIACVMVDGGRYQQLDRCHDESTCQESKQTKCATARKGRHWKESRIALLAKMTGSHHETDPQPDLPQALRYAVAAEKLTEIGKAGKIRGEADDASLAEETAREASQSCPEPPETHRNCGQFAREPAGSLEPISGIVPATGETSTMHRIVSREVPCAEDDRQRIVGPELEHRTVIASRRDWEAFGPLVASQAWELGFAAATEKVFVSDGCLAIEKLQKTCFSHYTSVLDILHALSYVLAAARAVSTDEAAARQQYDAWAALIWKGRVDEVISQLAAHAQRLGTPPTTCSETDPCKVVQRSHGFLTNHQSRMDYPTYRQKGFPLTSSLMESTVKQVSRRVKGSEKFWSGPGAEAMLCLRSAQLSDNRPLLAHLRRRAAQATGLRAYRKRRPATPT